MNKKTMDAALRYQIDCVHTVRDGLNYLWWQRRNFDTEPRSLLALLYLSERRHLAKAGYPFFEDVIQYPGIMTIAQRVLFAMVKPKRKPKDGYLSEWMIQIMDEVISYYGGITEEEGWGIIRGLPEMEGKGIWRPLTYFDLAKALSDSGEGKPWEVAEEAIRDYYGRRIFIL